MKRIAVLLFCMIAAIGVAVGAPKLFRKASQMTYAVAEGESSSILPQRTERVDSTPHDVYRLYSSGELVGVLSSRRELDAFLRAIYQELYAEQYPGSEVGLGTDVYLITEQSYMTYENIDQQIFESGNGYNYNQEQVTLFSKFGFRSIKPFFKSINS